MMCRLKKAAPAAACLACLLWPSIAHGQVTAPHEAAQLEYGPFSLYPSLVIADAGRDSNVFNDGQSPKDDYTFTVQSRALVVTRLGLNELMFVAGSDYVWFDKYKDQRSGNGSYALRFNFSASRFKPFVGATYERTRVRPNTEIDARGRRLERQLQAGSNFDLTERTAISVSASQQDSTYDRGEVFRGVDLSNALNKRGRSYSGGIRYALTPLTTLAMMGRYDEDIFPASHLRDSRIYTFSPTLEFNADAAIRGSLSAGLEVFKPKDTQLAEYKGATYLAALNWALFSNFTSFELRGNREVSYSYKADEPYYLTTTGHLGVLQKFIGPFELTGSIERAYLSYRWHLGVPATGHGEADITDTASGGIAINLKRGFKVLLTAEKSRRHASTDPTLNFQRTRLMSTITIGS